MLSTAAKFWGVWALCLALVVGVSPVVAVITGADNHPGSAGSCQCGAGCQCCVEPAAPQPTDAPPVSLPAPSPERFLVGALAFASARLAPGLSTTGIELSTFFQAEPFPYPVAIYTRHCSFLI